MTCDVTCDDHILLVSCLPSGVVGLLQLGAYPNISFEWFTVISSVHSCLHDHHHRRHHHAVCRALLLMASSTSRVVSRRHWQTSAVCLKAWCRQAQRSGVCSFMNCTISFRTYISALPVESRSPLANPFACRVQRSTPFHSVMQFCETNCTIHPPVCSRRLIVRLTGEWHHQLRQRHCGARHKDGICARLLILRVCCGVDMRVIQVLQSMNTSTADNPGLTAQAIACG